jgi:hypothetical protein
MLKYKFKYIIKVTSSSKETQEPAISGNRHISFQYFFIADINGKNIYDKIPLLFLLDKIIFVPCEGLYEWNENSNFVFSVNIDI